MEKREYIEVIKRELEDAKQLYHQYLENDTFDIRRQYERKITDIDRIIGTANKEYDEEQLDPDSYIFSKLGEAGVILEENAYNLKQTLKSVLFNRYEKVLLGLPSYTRPHTRKLCADMEDIVDRTIDKMIRLPSISQMYYPYDAFTWRDAIECFKNVVLVEMDKMSGDLTEKEIELIQECI